MTREYARVRLGIWADPDFRSLTDPAQALYFRLISSPTINLAGVADWRPKRIAALTAGMTAAQVEATASELSTAGYIVVDDATEEVLVRSFIRHDGLIKTPNIAASMVKDYAGVASPTLRGVIVHELTRLHDEDPAMKGWATASKLLSHPAINPSVMPSGNPSTKESGNPSVMPLPIPSGNGSHIPHPSSINPQPASTAPAGDRKRPARRLPADWVPNEAHKDQATKAGVDVTVEAETFRNHAQANDRTLVDWDAAFRNWLTKAKPTRRTERAPDAYIWGQRA